MFESLFSISQRLDETITRRLGCLLTNQSVEEDYPEISKLIPQPLIPSEEDEPKRNRLSTLQYDEQMYKEWKQMVSLLHLVNQDRVRLRELNFELLSIIHRGNLPSTDFGLFLAKSQQINYEFLKITLEKEREKYENLQKKLNVKLASRETQTEAIVTKIEPVISNFTLCRDLRETTPLSTRVHSRMGSDFSECS